MNARAIWHYHLDHHGLGHGFSAARRMFARRGFAHYAWIGALKSLATWCAYVMAVDIAGLPAWMAGIFIAGAMFLLSWALMSWLGVVASIALCLLIGNAEAHEAELSDGRVVDYQGMKSPTGSDCCGSRDCSAVEWRELDGGRLEVLLPQFGWVPVPAEKMLPPHPDAPDLFHVCFGRNSQVLKIYCVFPVGFGT